MNRVELLTSASRHECREVALVLAAAGIRHDVMWANGQGRIVVADPDLVPAQAELDAYREENVELSPSQPEVLRLSDGWVGVQLYVITLLVIYMLCRFSALDLNWLETGRMQAGQVVAGEWHRTITALTLHLDYRHLLGNLVFGALFGLFAGQLLGNGLAWFSILIAGALGNSLNALIQAPTHNAIGASTAVFAALGIQAAWSWQTRRAQHRRKHMRRWIPILGGLVLLGMLGFGSERTDYMAHITGFCSGILLGWIHSRWSLTLYGSPKRQFILGLATIGMIVVSWVLALTA